MGNSLLLWRVIGRELEDLADSKLFNYISIDMGKEIHHLVITILDILPPPLRLLVRQ